MTITAKCGTCGKELELRGETHLISKESYPMWALQQVQKGRQLGHPREQENNYYEVEMIDPANPRVKECDWDRCLEHRKIHKTPFKAIYRGLAAGVLALLLWASPAHALYNSRGNPSEGQRGLTSWGPSLKGGWGSERWTPQTPTVYNRNYGLVTYNGQSYGIQVEGSFNGTGTTNDRLAISWGKVGTATGQGFFSGWVAAAVATGPNAPSVTAGGALGGLVGAFIELWNQAQADWERRSGGTNISNTNCPCTATSTGSSADTGSR